MANLKNICPKIHFFGYVVGKDNYLYSAIGTTTSTSNLSLYLYTYAYAYTLLYTLDTRDTDTLINEFSSYS